MIGAIGGDIVGSVHEGTLVKRKDFPLFVPERFTDDTVLTVAVASAILRSTDYASSIRSGGDSIPTLGRAAGSEPGFCRIEHLLTTALETGPLCEPRP